MIKTIFLPVKSILHWLIFFWFVGGRGLVFIRYHFLWKWHLIFENGARFHHLFCFELFCQTVPFFVFVRGRPKWEAWLRSILNQLIFENGIEFLKMAQDLAWDFTIFFEFFCRTDIIVSLWDPCCVESCVESCCAESMWLFPIANKYYFIYRRILKWTSQIFQNYIVKNSNRGSREYTSACPPVPPNYNIKKER